MNTAGRVVSALTALGLVCACHHPERAGTEPRLSGATARVVAEAAPEPRRAEELARWVDERPADAARWLARQPTAAVLDSALAALATHPDVLVPRPAFAAEQAARIVDADLRRAALAEVLSTWARFDANAARDRLDRLDRIDDLERSHLRELLADAAALP